MKKEDVNSVKIVSKNEEKLHLVVKDGIVPDVIKV
jgi:hypothetical protein